MNHFLDFVNKVFDVCAEYAIAGVHYEREESGLRCWDDTLQDAIQDACLSISDAFDRVKNKAEWTPYSNGHYICGDYVLTGINNAFNDKRGFWISKKDCTKSFYCFTPINNSDLKKQLDNPQVWIDYFEKQMER